MTRVLPRLANALLTVGAVLGACCLALVLLGPVVGVRPLLFRSGSMSPTIETGDLALARSVPARELTVGDVVSVSTSGGARVTHRIVDVEHLGGAATLTLRGDANEAADAEQYRVTQADRVLVVVPWVGRVVAAAEGPWGLFLLGMGAAGLLTLAVRGGGDGGGDGDHRNDRPGRRRRTRRATGVVTGAAMAAVVAVAGPASAAPVPWTDDVGVSGTTLTASTIPATTLSCQSLNLLSLRFNWTAVAGATSYRLYYNDGSSFLDTTNTTATVGSLINGGSAWVVVRRNFGSTTWSSVNSNSVSYTVLLVAICG